MQIYLKSHVMTKRNEIRDHKESVKARNKISALLYSHDSRKEESSKNFSPIFARGSFQVMITNLTLDFEISADHGSLRQVQITKAAKVIINDFAQTSPRRLFGVLTTSLTSVFRWSTLGTGD